MYSELNDNDKKEYLYQKYIIENMSFQNIAKDLGLYANKLRRDAIKFDIPIRNKSQAQSNAIKTGSHKHPTKGKTRDSATKLKIGISVMQNWESMDEETLKDRKDKARQNWLKLSDDKKENMLDKANKAVRETSKTGSKLEKFLLNELINAGFKVDFHKEQVLSNTKLQIDLFLPTINLGIEVDGPSHFENIWGDESLKRNKTYDQKKEGLITGKGLSLIRVRQDGDFSLSRAKVLLDRLLPLLKRYNTPTSITLTY